MYISFMYSMCALGPVCGFLLGAYLLSLHVDTFTADVSQFRYTDVTDRNWIGMWWGGFLILGISLLTISIPFFFFPKELKVKFVVFFGIKKSVIKARTSLHCENPQIGFTSVFLKGFL